MDAAIACAFVQGVVDPLMCGIAGFGSCGIALPAKGFHGYIDFHAPAPLAPRPDMWADRIESEARDGYGFILRGPRERHRLPGHLRAGQPARLPRRPARARTAAVGADPGSPPSRWAEGGWTVRPTWGPGGPRTGRWGARPTTSGWRSRRPSRALYCRPDGTPSAWATGREPRPRPDAAADRQARRHRCSTRARSRTPSWRTCGARRPADGGGPRAAGAPRATRRSGAPTGATASRATSRPAAA